MTLYETVWTSLIPLVMLQNQIEYRLPFTNANMTNLFSIRLT